MKKIPTYFDRDWQGDRSRVVNAVNPAAQWVADGEGVATRKLDGACARIEGGKLYRRRELRQGEPEPAGFVLADTDVQTGKTVGWVPVGDGPEDRWFREAFDSLEDRGTAPMSSWGRRCRAIPSAATPTSWCATTRA